MKVRGLVRNDAKDQVKWRTFVMGSKRLTPTRVGKMASKCLLLLLLPLSSPTNSLYLRPDRIRTHNLWCVSPMP